MIFRSEIFQVMFSRQITYCLFLLFVFQASGQDLHEHLEEFQVVERKTIYTVNPRIQQLTRMQIQLLQAEDAGQLLQKFAGVSLKSYGGLGGMKTISVRGIGGTHTGIYMDGFEIQNTQTGQLDLSNIQAENIESMQLSIGGAGGQLLPVSAYLQGSVIAIQTFENQFSSQVIQVRSALKAGSFGQFDSYLALKMNRKKYFFSLFGKYRMADGNYPFEFMNGSNVYKGRRINNDLSEFFSGFSVGKRWGKYGILKMNYLTNVSDKGLPGAVILYNPTASQRLSNQSHQLNVDAKYIRSRVGLRTYFTTRYEDLNYVDSSFLNTAGFLDQSFYNTSVQLGVSFQTQAAKSDSSEMNVVQRKNNQYFGGMEHNYSVLHSSKPSFEQPIRNHFKAVVGTEFSGKKTLAILQLGGHFVSDQTQSNTKSMQRFALTPYAVVQAKRFHPIIGLPDVWIKRSFRMPSFNELYYNQLGNNNLKPEIANQVNVGTSYLLKQRNTTFKIRFDAYFNVVENKIVAIPTKNLFIWSIQNVGLVQVFGADAQFVSNYEWTKKWAVSSRVSYTFQSVIDISNRNSTTYGHQLPYLPKHTTNVDVTFKYKQSGIQFSGLLTSKRYALNENISPNQINAFAVFDCGIFHTWKFQNAQQLRLQFHVKNMFNTPYAFVRYYVMPGTNFLISINYALY